MEWGVGGRVAFRYDLCASARHFTDCSQRDFAEWAKTVLVPVPPPPCEFFFRTRSLQRVLFLPAIFADTRFKWFSPKTRRQVPF